MAVKIRLKRFGKKRAPYYRVVVMDSRTKRDGRAIEEIGKYHPTEEPSVIEINSERAQYWLSVGAQPTEQVEALLKLTGDWGTFKGDKNAKNTVKVKGEKVSAEDAIKAQADVAEKLKAEKSAKLEAAKAEKAAAAAAAAAEEEAAAAEVADAEVADAEVADEASEVPADEATEVAVEIAEGEPSEADAEVEGLADAAEDASEEK
jgi:small subunit ribosomal protein S16